MVNIFHLLTTRHRQIIANLLKLPIEWQRQVRTKIRPLFIVVNDLFTKVSILVHLFIYTYLQSCLFDFRVSTVHSAGVAVRPGRVRVSPDVARYEGAGAWQQPHAERVLVARG